MVVFGAALLFCVLTLRLLGLQRSQRGRAHQWLSSFLLVALFLMVFAWGCASGHAIALGIAGGSRHVRLVDWFGGNSAFGSF